MYKLLNYTTPSFCVIMRKEYEKARHNMNKQKYHPLFRKIGITLLILLVLAVAYMIYWVNSTYHSDKMAEAAMKSDSSVTVTKDDWISFMPEQREDTGFIFYPGGLVEPEAYVPLCRKIAEEGYLVVIVPMRWNLAVLSPDRAEEVIEKYNNIRKWTIGGHSLGGVMAAKFAAEHKEITGLALYAAYPQGDKIADTDLKVLSLYGSKDGVADLSKVKHAKLPNDAELIEIKGGNHCYFGSYGMQKGDNAADIAPEEQTDKAAEYTVNFLKML